MTRLLSIVTLLLLVTLVSACDDPRTIRACSCDVENAQRCNGNDVEWCVIREGCLEWTWMHSCTGSPEGDRCEMHGDMATCNPNCIDECANLGDTICSFDVLMTCESDYFYESEGCRVWRPLQDCAELGLICRPDLDTGWSCVADCEEESPAPPVNPTPEDGALDVDPDLTLSIQWEAVPGAGSYAVYFGSDCPPPAYPDDAFIPVEESSLAVGLEFDSTYCWQVVALSEHGCHTSGEVWSLTTGLPCQASPSCEDALARPTELAHLSEFNLVSRPWPPASLCHPPRLRLAVDRIRVHEELDDLSGDVVYCVITAEAPAGAALRVLPPSPALHAGEAHTLSLADGLVWGQLDSLITPGGALYLTYDCFEQDGPDAYQYLLDSLDAGALNAGGTRADERGWWFSTPGAVAPVVSAVLGMNADDHLFHAQQVIPGDDHLELISGGYWSVRRSGTLGASDWDWELLMTVWGCVDNGI
jgi:hypothetical protein